MDDALDRFKFRIWDKKRKVMLTEDNCYEEDDHYEHDEWWGAVTSLTITAISSFLECYNKDNLFVIMQCTGLKDKNGILIYEGDIVTANEYPFYNEKHKENNYRAEICWDRETASFFYYTFCINKKLGGISTGNTGQLCEYKWEVIGNIYANPTLLNK